MARNNTMMPKPPNHCITLRQNSMPCGCESMLFMIVAPVVVNPDIDSKKASVTLSMAPVKMNGSMPNTAKSTHATVTRTNESFIVMLSNFCTRPPLFLAFSRPAESRMNPKIPVIIVEASSDTTSFSPQCTL